MPNLHPISIATSNPPTLFSTSCTAGSSFAWIGDSAIASWGYSDGVDATAGNQPWGNTITGNICRELGLMEKQSSCYFQAQSSGSLVQGNIFYNGPR